MNSTAGASRVDRWDLMVNVFLRARSQLRSSLGRKALGTGYRRHRTTVRKITLSILVELIRVRDESSGTSAPLRPSIPWVETEARNPTCFTNVARCLRMFSWIWYGRPI